MNPEREAFIWRVTVRVAITILLVILVLAVWHLADILLLLFAGLMLAVFLRAASRPLAKRTRLSERAALSVFVVGLLALLTLIGWFIVPELASEVDQLQERIPQSLNQFEELIREYRWGQFLLEQRPPAETLVNDQGGTILSRIFGAVSSAVEAVAFFAVTLAVGLYFPMIPLHIVRASSGWFLPGVASARVKC